MERQVACHAADPETVARTRKLIEYVLRFVRNTHTPVRDCRRYDSVLWLADVPEGVIRGNVARGRVLMEVDYRTSQPAPELPAELEGWVAPEKASTPSEEDPPLAETGPGRAWAEAGGDQGEVREVRREEASEVLRAYAAWLPRWRRWSAAEREVAPYRELHKQLHRIAARVREDEESVEAVLAVGLLTIGSRRKGARVRRHLLTVPVQIDVAPENTRISVSISENGSTRLEDGDFLGRDDGYSTELLSPVRSLVEDEDVLPLTDAAQLVLKEWAGRAFGPERPVQVDFDWRPPRQADMEIPAVRVTQAPALILRARGQGAMVSFYESIKEQLSRPEAESPLGLAQCLFSLEPQQRMAWGAREGERTMPALGSDPLFPLPANKRQLEILEQLQKDTGVVVQGPPGTGKTHTIANLISALLADGRRVLVTSEKAQALRVLRDQIPPGLRSLCVFQGDRRQDGVNDLEQSIRTLSQVNAGFSVESLTETIAQREEERTRLLEERQKTRERIRMLREVEWYRHPEVAPGYQGTLAEIVRAMKRREPEYAWMPPLPPGAPAMPPVNRAEAQRLTALVDKHGPEVLAAYGEGCPNPRLLPTASEFELALKECRATSRSVQETGANALAEELAARGDELIAVLLAHVDAAVRVLQSQGFPADLTAWKPGEWYTLALHDGMAGLRAPLWTALRSASGHASAVQSALNGMALTSVDIPEMTPGQEIALISAGRDPERLLNQGGWLHRPFMSTEQKEAHALLRACRVDGRVPATTDAVTALVTHVEARRCVRLLNDRWRDIGAKPVDGSTAAALAELLDRAARLVAVDGFSETARQVHRILLDARVGASVQSPEEWESFRAALDHARRIRAAERARRRLDELIARVPDAGPKRIPELAELHRAIAARDPHAYQLALEGLRWAYLREADRREARAILDRLAAGHPALVSAYLAAPTDPAWRRRLPSLGEAWAWRKAYAFQQDMLAPGAEQEEERKLSDIEAALARTVEELATDRARKHCLQRMTTRQKQALNAYASAMAHVGKGTGPRSHVHLRDAKSAMRVAQDAVPAWIMPIKQVAEMISPTPDSFDVVIVDEASQVGLDGLMLLWLAPRVIVVGDDKQCAPFYTAGKHEELDQDLEQLLNGLDAWQQSGLRAKSNLYELLQTRFGRVIRLTEHFRSMPEIIGWSSAQFYGDDELVPLRQYGADRLDPLRVVHVPEGHCTGNSERLVNEPEAKRLVSTLKELTDDPAYKNRTIGVIVLHSGMQVRHLQNLVDSEIEAPVRERHRIRVGTAEQFQGDERDVILLSMVIDGDRTRMVGGRDAARRLNVAASRARDQMWLFTSVTADQLRSEDLRHSLLTYMQSPPVLQGTSPRLEDVSEEERCAPFDSLFEQKVFRSIRARGYHVVPQWRVGNKRIDLVVVGRSSRLAVECDGSPYHSTPEQLRQDFERERELRRAGWQFFRVRSSDFELCEETALEGLWKRLDALGIEPNVTPKETERAGEEWTPAPLDDAASETGTDAENDTDAPLA